MALYICLDLNISLPVSYNLKYLKQANRKAAAMLGVLKSFFIVEIFPISLFHIDVCQ